jgi:hypothetical protein
MPYCVPMKFFAVLAILSLIAISILGDFLWKRWISARKAERDPLNGPRA